MKAFKTLFLGVFLACATVVCASSSQDDKFFQPRELIQVSNDDVQMAYDQTSAEVVVKAKSAYEMYCRSQWLKATMKGNNIVVEAERNTGFVPRTAKVILTTKKENVSRVVSFTQAPEPGHDQYYALPTTGNIMPMVKMDLSKATHDPWIPEIYKNRSLMGHPIKIKNNTYESAICTHAKSVFKVQLNGAMRFVSDIGIDDEVLVRTPENHGDAKYIILLDGKEVASGHIKLLDKLAQHIDVNTHGAKIMELILDPNGSNWGDHISLGNPYFELTSAKPELID